MSQSRPEIDRVSVMAGLAASEKRQDREVARFIQPAGISVARNVHQAIRRPNLAACLGSL